MSTTLLTPDFQLSGIDEQLLNKVAACYANVFNHSWGENWSHNQASDKIIADLSPKPNRTPFASFLQNDDGDIVGFSWGIVVNVSSILPLDMPPMISQDCQREGVEVLQYWMRVFEDKKLLIFSEMGVEKEYRGMNFGRLALPVLLSAINMGIKRVALWTSPRSRAFQWAIGSNGIPVHTFSHAEICIMMGKCKEGSELYTLLFSADDTQRKMAKRHIVKRMRGVL